VDNRFFVCGGGGRFGRFIENNVIVVINFRWNVA